MAASASAAGPTVHALKQRPNQEEPGAPLLPLKIGLPLLRLLTAAYVHWHIASIPEVLGMAAIEG
jgi:hypothetical protein